MPFTPIHMGAALAAKPLAGRWFSVTVFGIAQVAMDLEPLVRVIRDDDVVHGPTHTFVAAIPIGLAVFLVAPPFCGWLLRWWNARLVREGLPWLQTDAGISRTAALTGAFVGTLSHVVVDGIMHADMRPLEPFSSVNPFLGVLSIEALQSACVAGGLFGVGAWFVAGWRRRRRSGAPVR